jgi:hypothetical protein
MDWNRFEGNWKQFKGHVKEKWGRLTDDDLDVINGGPGQKGCRHLVQDNAVSTQVVLRSGVT